MDNSEYIIERFIGRLLVRASGECWPRGFSCSIEWLPSGDICLTASAPAAVSPKRYSDEISMDGIVNCLYWPNEVHKAVSRLQKWLEEVSFPTG